MSESVPYGEVRRRGVLVVEDDESIREALCELLELEGIQAAGTVHGLEALQYLESAEALPGLILLDLNMPTMSGLVFLEHLRAREAWSRIPVVVMTAVPGASVPGVAALLRKPVDLELILDKVQALL